VKGNVHWVSVKHAHEAEVRLYERLFKTEKPEGQADLNPDSLKKISAQLEPSVGKGDKGAVQFERHGYFLSDRGAYNRTVGLHTSFFGGAFFGGGFLDPKQRK
jgi:glutaminyl-tRNA synthetase